MHHLDWSMMVVVTIIVMVQVVMVRRRVRVVATSPMVIVLVVRPVRVSIVRVVVIVMVVGSRHSVPGRGGGRHTRVVQPFQVWGHSVAGTQSTARVVVLGADQNVCGCIPRILALEREEVRKESERERERRHYLATGGDGGGQRRRLREGERGDDRGGG